MFEISLFASYLVAVAESTVPSLESLNDMVRSAGIGRGFGLNIQALTRAILYRNMVVVGDIQTLSR